MNMRAVMARQMRVERAERRFWNGWVLDRIMSQGWYCPGEYSPNACKLAVDRLEERGLIEWSDRRMAYVAVK